MNGIVHELGRRVGAVIASVPGHYQVDEGAPVFQVSDSAPPPWLLLPIWLDEAWQEQGSAPPRCGAVANLVWGTYALVLNVRIKDDLLDRHRSDLRHLFVADRLLLESLEQFQNCPELDGAFWGFYRDCLRNTIDGILEVQRLEAIPGLFTAAHLHLHSQVGSIFKLGATAVCRLHRRTADLPWVSNLLDCLAVFSQLFDDLQDVAQDLEVDRFTWVANTLLAAAPGAMIVPGDRGRRLGEGYFRAGRGELVIEEMRRLARSAAEGVPASAPSQVLDLLAAIDSRPEALEQGMHEARVRWVFGEAVGRT